MFSKSLITDRIITLSESRCCKSFDIVVFEVLMNSIYENYSCLQTALLGTYEPIRQPENELGEDRDKYQDRDVAEEPRQ